MMKLPAGQLLDQNKDKVTPDLLQMINGLAAQMETEGQA